MPRKTPVHLHWTGLVELKQQLGAIPANLLESSRQAVELATRQVVAGLKSIYPVGTSGRFYKGTPITPGGLRRGVRMSLRTTATGTVGTVKSTAPHAHLWEFGTKRRDVEAQRQERRHHAAAVPTRAWSASPCGNGASSKRNSSRRFAMPGSRSTAYERQRRRRCRDLHGAAERCRAHRAATRWRVVRRRAAESTGERLTETGDCSLRS